VVNINLKPGESIRFRVDENYNLIYLMNPKERLKRPSWGLFLFTIIAWTIVGFGLGTLFYDWVK
jgi:hypothetical protein